MYIESVKRVINYWIRILKVGDDRYIKKAYSMLMMADQHGHRNWVTYVKNILLSCGFGYVWYNQEVLNESHFIALLKQSLNDQYRQEWHSSIIDSEKLKFYSCFKSSLCHEIYLDCVNIRKYRNALACFRCSSHNLEIEYGRYSNIHRDQRFCKLCKNVVETEYHFLLKCPFYSNIRKTYLPKKYYENATFNNCIILMRTKNENLLRDIAMYIYFAMQHRNTLLQAL